MHTVAEKFYHGISFHPAPGMAKCPAMASLVSDSDQRRHSVAVRTVIGRAPECHIVETHSQVSGLHAAVEWDGAGWFVRDLGSRNGTFVDGVRLPAGERVAITVGSRLVLGDAGAVYTLVDGSEPVPMAICGVDTVHAASGLLALPDASNPEVMLYQSDGHWLIEDDAGTRPAPLQILADGRMWTVHLPVVLAATADTAGQIWLRDLRLRLAVSQDEEYVEPTLAWSGQSRTLKFKSHHYLLVVLARLRLDDTDQSDPGWVDAEALVRMMALERRTMNVQVFRARGELFDLGVVDAVGLIERRGTCLRLGIEHVEVVGLVG